MSTSDRFLLLALVIAGGCAQAEGNGLSNAGDGTFPMSDLGPDFAQASPGYDFAGTPYDAAVGNDLSSNLQVCDLHKVRVNEVQTQGAGGATDEFIELYNPCTAAVSLNGAKIIYRSASATTDDYTLWLFSTESIPALGFYVVANTEFTGTPDAKPFMAGSGLAAAGGGVGYRDSTGALIDSVGWGTAANGFVENTAVGAPSATQSAARTVDGVDTNNNLADFSLGTPTPGASN